MQAANSHCPEGYLKRNPMRELALPGYSTPFAFPYFQVAFAAVLAIASGSRGYLKSSDAA